MHDPSRRCAASCGALSASGLPEQRSRVSRALTAAFRASGGPKRLRGSPPSFRGSFPAPVFSFSRPRTLLSGGREFNPRIGTTTTYLHWGARRCPAAASSDGPIGLPAKLRRGSPAPVRPCTLPLAARPAAPGREGCKGSSGVQGARPGAAQVARRAVQHSPDPGGTRVLHAKQGRPHRRSADGRCTRGSGADAGCCNRPCCSLSG